MDIGLLLLRFTIGFTFFAHGTQILFGWFGGYGLDATGRAFSALGFPSGRRHALFAGLAQTGAGILLGSGFLTPAASAICVSVMLVAAVSAHLEKGFFIQNGGYEYTLVLGVAGLTVAFTGPGECSVDSQLGYSLRGVAWGVSAFLIGLVGGVLPLIERRKALLREELIE